MKYAVINSETNIVENAIVWDGVTPYTPPAGTVLVNIDEIACGPGWIQQPDGSFVLPPEPDNS